MAEPIIKGVLNPCPYCGSFDLEDCYVYIKCNKCEMRGPCTCNGMYASHADYWDHQNAIKKWNALKR